MQKRHSATRIRCRGASTFAAWDGQEDLKQKRDCGYRAEPGYENAGVPVRGFPLALLAERLPALRQPLMVVFEPEGAFANPYGWYLWAFVFLVMLGVIAGNIRSECEALKMSVADYIA